jgi:hypothetical protein
MWEAFSFQSNCFVRGRFILASVVSAHKIIPDVVKKKQKGMILKVDYEKAYDRVDWNFLREMMSSRGFGEK